VTNQIRTQNRVWETPGGRRAAVSNTHGSIVSQHETISLPLRIIIIIIIIIITFRWTLEWDTGSLRKRTTARFTGN